MDNINLTQRLDQPVDVCRVAVAQLRDERDQLLDRCEALEDLAISRGDDAASYQLLAKQAIEAFHREQIAHGKLRERYDRLVEEYREHRARTLADVGAAA